MKNILIAIFFTALISSFWFGNEYPQTLSYIDGVFGYIERGMKNVSDNLADVIAHNPVTVDELRVKYDSPAADRKIRVLVVPGHEPNDGGTQYGNLKERDLNVELSRDLADFLKKNGHYEVMLARDENTWSPALEDYFTKNWNEIIAFTKNSKSEQVRLVKSGAMTEPVVIVDHLYASPDSGYRLYGINKWENENDIDIALHVHFNDYDRRLSSPGKYSGFSIYVPEHQYANSTTTKALAEDISKRLSKYTAVSDLPGEETGLIEEPQLIAIGANNTTNSASMLIEYSYIYEPQIVNPLTRSKIINDMAFQTYLGFQDFFGSGNDVSLYSDTSMLPFSWKNNLNSSTLLADDILALQSAFMIEGVYPPKGRTLNDCPRTGKIGPCTLASIAEFQKKYEITGEAGIVGAKTRKILNDKYSVRSL